jgi:cobalamin biosynthesis protein CobT
VPLWCWEVGTLGNGHTTTRQVIERCLAPLDMTKRGWHTPHAIMRTGAPCHFEQSVLVSFRAERPRVISSRARNLGIQRTPHAIMRTGGHHCMMSRFARHDKEGVAHAARHNANRRPVSFRAERPRVISSGASSCHFEQSEKSWHPAHAARHNANRRSSLYDVSLRST